MIQYDMICYDIVSGSYPLTIVCRWSLMSYSGSETHVSDQGD